MNRPLTALFAALEALLVVGIGIGIALVPLTFLWGFHYGLQIDWTVFWRASADFWLLGHGADVTLTLDPALATSAGFPEAGTPFVVSIAALGVGLLTVLLAVRAGRRIAETPFATLGFVTAFLVFGLLSTGITFSSLHEFARVSLWQGMIFPSLVFGAGLVIGSRIGGRPPQKAERAPKRQQGRVSGASARGGTLQRWWGAQPSGVRGVLAQSLRGGAAAAAIVVAVASVLLAVLIVANYSQVIALYEGIHAGVLGGVTVTLAELAFLPNLVVWVASWLVGPGFAIGAGSSVSPLGTSLGPLPAVPVFGALPAGDFAFGFLGLLVPIVAAFLAGVAVRPALLRAAQTGAAQTSAAGADVAEHRSVEPLLLAAGVGIGLAGGALLGILAWMSGGAAGPGRLAEVGPDALLVALWAALEFGAAAILGLLVGRPARST